jgi:hypothetical protein
LLLWQSGIFIETDMMNAFQDAIGMLHAAQVERHVEFRHRVGSSFKEVSRLLQDGDRVFGELQSAVRATLLGGTGAG